jgi:hypothetical protein
VGPEIGDECEDGWVRSNPFLEECDQKFEGEPIKAFRCVLSGIVDDMVVRTTNVLSSRAWS